MEYLSVGAASAVSIFFFALSVSSRRKNAIIAGALGGLSFVIYSLLSSRISPVGAVFLATLFGCLCAEAVARIVKTPATVFSVPIIIPLVPGLTLYRSMLCFGQGDNAGGMAFAISALLIAGSMSLAVTLATIFAKLVTEAQRKRKDKKQV